MEASTQEVLLTLCHPGANTERPSLPLDSHHPGHGKGSSGGHGPDAVSTPRIPCSAGARPHCLCPLCFSLRKTHGHTDIRAQGKPGQRLLGEPCAPSVPRRAVECKCHVPGSREARGSGCGLTCFQHDGQASEWTSRKSELLGGQCHYRLECGETTQQASGCLALRAGMSSGIPPCWVPWVLHSWQHLGS